MVLNHVISHTPYPPSSRCIHVFIYKSFRPGQNHFTFDEVGHTFRILVLAIMDLNDQELSIPLEEYERTMFDISELFLPQLENRLDRTIICAAVESRAMRFSMFIFIFTLSAKRLFEIP